MARSKSTSGDKTSRSNRTANKTADKTNEQPGITNPVSNPDASAVVAETASAGAQPETKIKETKITPENRKFDVHKTEPRKNVVPINLEDEIRRRAFELYQQRGSASGSEAQDWLAAEREVRQRYHQQSA
jgi:hypothetical protein